MLYAHADNGNTEVTTLPAGSTINITFHVAYPHRVSIASYIGHACNKDLYIAIA